MAVANSLVKQQDESKAIEYLCNGEMVKLSPGIIKKYLVNGNGNVSDEEVVMFLNLCRFQHLNPFLREAYLIKFGTSPATMVVGKDAFTKRARKNKDYKGHEAGIIVLTQDGEVKQRTGTFYLSQETLVGGWAKVHIEGYQIPMEVNVSLDEYIGTKSNGEVNSQWAKKPATMIRKVALVQALKESFPEDLAGMNGQEEMGVDELLDTPINMPTEEVTIVQSQPIEANLLQEIDPLA